MGVPRTRRIDIGNEEVVFFEDPRGIWRIRCVDRYPVIAGTPAWENIGEASGRVIVTDIGLSVQTAQYLPDGWAEQTFPSFEIAETFVRRELKQMT
jgi:hypothetical protein